jgi:hypothetical protein
MKIAANMCEENNLEARCMVGELQVGSIKDQSKERVFYHVKQKEERLERDSNRDHPP